MGDIRLTRDFFLWCMAVVYLFAFTSLYVQIPGLYGDNGILPAKLVLQDEADSLWDLATTQPTLLRLLPKLGLDVETGMDFLCLAGIVLSFVAMVTRAHRNRLVFMFLWMFYLSFCQIGQTFLHFQWDILLLEAGFLTLLLAPFNWGGLSRRPAHHHHDPIILWLVRWLTFRLMYASGIVKLTSGCPTWWGLTALNYHFETQCIPTPLAWWAHQSPEWLLKLGVVATYVVEVPLPVMFFSPVRSQRIFSFYLQVFLMGLIILTGNYNFFNWLYNIVCLSIIDDDLLRSWMGKKPREDKDSLRTALSNSSPVRALRRLFNCVVYGSLIYWTVRLFDLHFRTRPMRLESKTSFDSSDLDRFLRISVPVTIWIGVLSLASEIISAIVNSIVTERGLVKRALSLLGCAVFGTAAVCLFAISLVDHTQLDRTSHAALSPVLHRWHQQTSRLHLTSSYGLFRTMTGVGGRPEVIIEGSNSLDKGWKEYHFLYKPGNVSSPLPIVAPHQPRLDWQMWFAALGTYHHNPWLLNLVYRLLTNQKEVLELMGENPFPDKPPMYIRANLYHYYYTRASHTHKWYSRSRWWVRKHVREYLPIISKDEQSFVTYLRSAGIYPNKKKREPSSSANILKTIMRKVRAVCGQANGFRSIVSLFTTALVLSIVDPALKRWKH